MKECELCERPARMYCESDQASLCWACDAKVHSANFLVARHSRSLLCQACQVPTPWQASGPRLGPTVSVCHKCVGRCGGRQPSDVEVDSGEKASERTDEEEEEDDGDEYDDDDDEEDEEDEEDGENQVVPWTSSPLSSLSGPAASPSSEGESFGYGLSVFGTPTTALTKRRRENVDFLFQDRIGCSSSQANSGTGDDDAVSSIPSRATKDRKITSSEKEPVTCSNTNLIGTLRSPQNGRPNRVDTTNTIVDTCNLSEDRPSAVDLVSNGSDSHPM